MCNPHNLGRVLLTQLLTAGLWGYPTSPLLKTSVFPAAPKPAFSVFFCIILWEAVFCKIALARRKISAMMAVPRQAIPIWQYQKAGGSSKYLQRVRAAWVNLCKTKRSACITWATAPLSSYRSHSDFLFQKDRRCSAHSLGRHQNSWPWNVW